MLSSSSRDSIVTTSLELSIGEEKENNGGKGSSINDVMQFWTIFDRPSTHRHAFYY